MNSISENRNELAEEIVESIFSQWLPADGMMVDIKPLARMAGYDYSDEEFEELFSNTLIFIG